MSTAYSLRNQAPRRPATHMLTSAIALHRFAMESAGRSDSTRAQYALVLGRYLAFVGNPKTGDAPISALSLSQARAFLIHVRKTYHLGDAGVHQHGRKLKAFARFLVAEGVIRAYSFAALHLPREPQPTPETFTPDQLRALLSVIDRRIQAPRNRAILYFLLSTGLRASELCSLKWADLDLKGKRVKLWGKGNRERWAYFDAVTAQCLLRYLALRKGDVGQYVFLSRTGERFSRGALYQLFRDLGQDAGLTDCHPHMCRHTFAVSFLRAHPGAVFHLQQLLGHTKLEMTRRYARLAEAEAPLPGPNVIELLGLSHLPRRR